MVNINSKISYIKATDSPISSDVVFIKTDDTTWIFDVGSVNEPIEQIQKIKGKKNIVLSHFHPDHVSNIFKVSCDNLYVGNNTAKYITHGTVINEPTTIGAVEILPIVNCHAKGSLILKFEDYAFLGDALYASFKMKKKCYNVQLVQKEIEFLNKLDVKYICLSHDRSFVREKQTAISVLEKIYAQRQGNNPLVFVN